MKCTTISKIISILFNISILSLTFAIGFLKSPATILSLSSDSERTVKTELPSHDIKTLEKMENSTIQMKNKNNNNNKNDTVILSTRIIGGHEAKPHSAPFIVSLQRRLNGNHGCSGSIISKNIIITAAHCLKSDNLTDIYAIAGLQNRFEVSNLNLDDNIASSTIQKIRVINYIRHENFTNWNISGPNDIALLFLEKGFKFNENITKVHLPNSNKQLNGIATLYGWGRTRTDGPIKERADNLQAITTDLLTYEKCKELLPNNKRLHSTNICTGRFGEASVACHGDSGGPLIQNINGTDVLVGIVSWGFRICGWISKPSIYTSVGAFLDWIWRNARQCDIL